MTGCVVVGIGNPFRRDDGVAAAVAGQVRRSSPPALRVVEVDGDPARLMEAWAGAELAVVIDAARSAGAAGTVRRIELATVAAARPVRVPATRPTSSHGCSVQDAVELGRALGRLPARLVIYAVEGDDFGDGPGLSPPVARAVPEVAARVLGDVAAWTGTAAPGGGAG